MTATSTTTPATDDDEPHTIDHEPDDSTGSRTPGRPAVTLGLDADDAHHLVRIAENEIAAFLGPAYLRNAFTKGTEQEVDFLVEALELGPGATVLNVGFGPTWAEAK